MSAERAKQLSLRHVLDVDPSLTSGVQSVSTRRVLIDQLGEAHTRLIQTEYGIPVFGGEAIVHLDAQGKFSHFTDGFVRGVRVNTRPVLSDVQATDLAVAKSGGWGRIATAPVADLQILRHGGADHLTYRVRLDQSASDAPAIPVVFIDAVTGAEVWRYDDLQTARNRNTYTANNGTTLPGTLVRNEASGPSGDAVLNQAHDNAGLTYDYYFTRFGRDSYNNAGATILSTVHYSANYVNAFWNGTQMVYGDGDGVQSSPLTVLDVVGHELTHAVTSSSSNLVYANESGALNEAMSDIFGASIEHFRDFTTDATSLNTYKIGEECWTPATSGDALRYMYDPAIAGDRDYYPDRYTGTADNGGVHTNSGIANLAFYLLAEGGTHPRGKTTTLVGAIGITKAAAIFYRANTVHLTPSSNFSAARTATLAAATTLYGAASNEVTQVGNAWTAVGVLPPPSYAVIDQRTGLSGGASTNTQYGPYSATSATAMKFQISGGTGDADLYVRFGAAPTTSLYNCRPYTAGNNETCEFNPSQSGNYYVMIRGYSAYSGLTLTVSRAGGGSGTETLCGDGIDNDGDSAIDCADSDCAASPSCQWVVQSTESFESGLGPYTDGGNDASRVAANASTGSYSMNIQDNSGAASSFYTTTGMNLAGKTQLRIQFSMIAVSMENGEDYFVEVSTGGGAYQVVATRASGTHFSNNVRKSEDIQIALPGTSDVKVRLRCDASNDADDVYIDDLVISAR